MTKKNLLIVEDEPEQMEAYSEMLSYLGYKVFEAQTLELAIDYLQNQAIDLIVTDIHLTNAHQRITFEGFDLLKHARANHPECLSIVMSNDPNLSTYHKTFELGAMGYVKKPVLSTDEFELTIAHAYEKREALRLKEKGESNAPLVLGEWAKDGLVLDDDTRESAYLLAQTKELPGIIYGETGTGKEEIAKLIHKKRVEAEGMIPFVAVNCANLDSSTAASHLFGHKKGSVTGADSTTIGYVGEADGGILFLDEIHTLSVDNQRKLLRVLNDGTYQRFGDTKTLHAQFQVIVATGRNLDELVRTGGFIPDLRSRITGIMISLRPLRERPKDLNLLIPLIFHKIGATLNPSEMKAIITRCREFYWQDNIRKLFNTLKATALICQCKRRPITADDLQVYPSMLAPDQKMEMRPDPTEYPRIAAALSGDFDFNESVEIYEKAVIQEAIKRHGPLSKVVEKIKISRSTLDSKRKKYGITAGD